MKIIQKNDNRMVLKDRPYFAYIVGAIFFVAGLFMYFDQSVFSNAKDILWWHPIFSAGLGAFVIFVANVETVILDKGLNKIILSYKSLLKKERKEIILNKIKQINLQANYNQSRSGSSYDYILLLVLDTGEQIPLQKIPTSAKTVNGIAVGANSTKILGQEIATFLNVPFEEMRPPTLTEMLNAIKEGIENNPINNNTEGNQNIQNLVK